MDRMIGSRLTDSMAPYERVAGARSAKSTAIGNNVSNTLRRLENEDIYLDTCQIPIPRGEAAEHR